MYMQFPLSIYIPTFNRVETLLQLLNSIKEICTDQVRSSIEVVVSDNASTDLTQQMMKVALDNKFIDKYIRYSSNRGADENISNCFYSTNGNFVWILCDDDLPNKNSIENILSIIESKGDEISLIYTNRSIEFMNGDIISNRYTNCSEGVVNDVASFLNIPGHDLLTASTLVLKNNKLLGECFKRFGRNRFVSPLTLALDSFTNGPAYLFSEPQVRYREGDKSGWIGEWPQIWKKTVPEVFEYYAGMHDISFEDLDPKIYRGVS